MGKGDREMKSAFTVVSLAWNKIDLTRDFLRKLKENTDVPFDFVFTDNGSVEPISELVTKMFPNVTLIRKEENVGCPRTRNEQMEHVKTDITFWLDNDAMVGPGWYKPILEKLKEDDVGISGPKGCVVRYPFDLGYPFEEVPEGEVDYFVGYLMGFKTKLYKPINDYNLPVNLDDVECCWGVKENGGKAVISGPCAVVHLTSQTERGWETTNNRIEDMWNNWPDKSMFVNYRHTVI